MEKEKTVKGFHDIGNGLPVIYLAGKVTGLPYDQVEQKFYGKEAELIAKGFYVINPIRLIHQEASHNEAMKICFCVLPHADYICLLPDWYDSKGAKMEKAVADMLGIEVYRPDYDKGEPHDNIHFV